MALYEEDLAFIHDAGFSDYGERAAPGLLRLLRRGGIGSGSVVDLGCGSGRWAAMLAKAGYSVTGMDQSAALLRLARKRVRIPDFRIVTPVEAEALVGGGHGG